METPRIIILLILAVAAQFAGNMITECLRRRNYRGTLASVLSVVMLFIVGIVMVYPVSIMLAITLGPAIAGMGARWLVVALFLRKP